MTSTALVFLEFSPLKHENLSSFVVNSPLGKCYAMHQMTAIPVAQARAVQWRLRAPAPIKALEVFSRTLGLSPKVAAVLYARGIHSADALEPSLELNPNPALLEAAERIVLAIRAGKRIRIHGDYDADGITGASVLMLGLRELGAKVHAFIPHRLTDGYGVHPDRVPEHLEACELFITVDCGVSNLEEIARIVAGGAEAIVTDHHAPGHDLPGCLVVHPALAPNYHPDLPALTGSGVAFHLLWAVRQHLGEPPPLEYADLASIGTIADLAPLLGENRALVKAGLAQMRDSRWTGIRAMLEGARITVPTARDVGFVIAPRINAAGRLGEADVALELLTTDSAQRALTLATYLDARNVERKKIQEDMFKDALEVCDPEAPALVVTKDGWHPGVMGIVASKLLERFYKPVFIIAAGKGSVRGGFALYEECIPGFRASILDFARQFPDPVETVVADSLLSPREVTNALLRQVQFLEPFGQGNPAPMFWVRDALRDAGGLGKEGKHFQYRFGHVRGKQWGVGVPFSSGDPVDAAVQIEENSFNGRTSLEFTTTKMRYQGRLSLVEEDLDGGIIYPRVDTKAELERLKSQPAPLFANHVALEFVRKTYPEIPVLEDDSLPETLTLIAMPEPAQLERWIHAGVPLRFALTERTLSDLENREWYSLEDLRDFEIKAKRGAVLPPRAKTMLDEVRGLEDAVAYRSSHAVLRDELELYRAVTFARFYRAADDAAFSRAVRALYGGIEVERRDSVNEH
jgi:single-stranded-DNA-specific exonuclease